MRSFTAVAVLALAFTGSAEAACYSSVDCSSGYCVQSQQCTSDPVYNSAPDWRNYQSQPVTPPPRAYCAPVQVCGGYPYACRTELVCQ